MRFGGPSSGRQRRPAPALKSHKLYHVTSPFFYFLRAPCGEFARHPPISGAAHLLLLLLTLNEFSELFFNKTLFRAFKGSVFVSPIPSHQARLPGRERTARGMLGLISLCCRAQTKAVPVIWLRVFKNRPQSPCKMKGPSLLPNQVFTSQLKPAEMYLSALRAALLLLFDLCFIKKKRREMRIAL